MEYVVTLNDITGSVHRLFDVVIEADNANELFKFIKRDYPIDSFKVITFAKYNWE